jgi:hypothetical protein
MKNISINLHIKQIKKSQCAPHAIASYDLFNKDIDVYLYKYSKEKFDENDFITDFENTVTHESLHYLINDTIGIEINYKRSIAEEAIVRTMVDNISLKEAYFNLAVYYKTVNKYDQIILVNELRNKLIKWLIIANIIYMGVMFIKIMIK